MWVLFGCKQKTTKGNTMSQTTEFITVVDEETLLTFVYGGGAYIEVFGEGWHGVQDVINVYDYKAGKPSIEYTEEAVKAKVKGYLEDRD